MENSIIDKFFKLTTSAQDLKSEEVFTIADKRNSKRHLKEFIESTFYDYIGF